MLKLASPSDQGGDYNDGNRDKDRNRSERNPVRLWPSLIAAVCHYIAGHTAEPPKYEEIYSRKLVVWTSIIAIGTWASAIFALGAALIFWSQLRDSRQALVAQERAWVFPMEIEVAQNDMPKVGQPFRFQIDYFNTGKQPALDMTFAVDAGVTNPPRNNDLRTVKLRPNITCDDLEPRRGGNLLYPTTTVALKRTGDTGSTRHRVFLSDAIIHWAKDIFIQGCIAFRTMKETKKSAFCFMVLNEGGNGLAVNCPDGNFADE